MQPTPVMTRTVEIADTAQGYRVTKYVHVWGGDTVTFHNATDDIVTMHFDKEGIFGRNQLKLSRGSSKDLTVANDAPLGFHTYAVFCHGRMEFAEGGSMPIIIVDPKS